MLSLIKKEINKNIVDTIDGRLLHKSLESSEKYPVWANRQIKYFEENYDFLEGKVNLPNGRVGIIHYFTLDTAKHICLMSRTIKGKVYRKELINFEKEAHKEIELLKKDVKYYKSMYESSLMLLESKVEPMKLLYEDAVAEAVERERMKRPSYVKEQIIIKWFKETLIKRSTERFGSFDEMYKNSKQHGIPSRYLFIACKKDTKGKFSQNFFTKTIKQNFSFKYKKVKYNRESLNCFIIK